MPNKIDFTGNKFGKLTAICHVGFIGSKKRRSWKALCECGKEWIGIWKTSKSCGCLKKENRNEKNKKDDLTGQKFGRLTVISCVGRDKKRQRLWECTCECGNTNKLTTNCLRFSGAVSCGCSKKISNEKRKDLFLARVEKTETCWIWKGGLNENGYGQFRYLGKNQMAHRAAYRIFKDSVMTGYHVLHKCDNPSCVNPDHLFLGTHADNMRDKVSKNRQKGGYNFWLDDRKKSAIKCLYANGFSVKEIADFLKITLKTTRTYTHSNV